MKIEIGKETKKSGAQIGNTNAKVKDEKRKNIKYTIYCNGLEFSKWKECAKSINIPLHEYINTLLNRKKLPKINK